MQRNIKKIATWVGGVLVGIIFILIMSVGIPFGWGEKILPLKDYQSIENHTIAIKFNSVDILYLPFVTWHKEYIAITPSTDGLVHYKALDENLSNLLQKEYGNFSDHESWKYSWGWTIGLFGILLFFSCIVAIISEGYRPEINVDVS